jgi:hypothetical protein
LAVDSTHSAATGAEHSANSPMMRTPYIRAVAIAETTPKAATTRKLRMPNAKPER